MWLPLHTYASALWICLHRTPHSQAHSRPHNCSPASAILPPFSSKILLIPQAAGFTLLKRPSPMPSHKRGKLPHTFTRHHAFCSTCHSCSVGLQKLEDGIQVFPRSHCYISTVICTNMLKYMNPKA